MIGKSFNNRQGHLRKTPARALTEPLEPRRLLSAGLSASAQVTLDSTGGTPAAPVYHYSVTLRDTGTTSVGTLWLAWVPGADFLPSVPFTETSPAGWARTLIGSGNVYDGTSIQWVAQTPASALKPGQALGGFAFTSKDSPAVLAGRSSFFPGSPVLTSFVYSGTPFSDPGFQFIASPPPPVSARAKLAVAAQPNAGIAGATLNRPVVLDVESASGAALTSDTSKVTLSIASGPAGAKVGGTLTVPAVKGVATFTNLTFTVAGTYTLRASDGVLASALTKTITISPAPAAKLVISSQPITGTAGKVLSPALAVKVEDTFGNVVTGDSSLVKIAVASGPAGGTVAGTLSAKAVKGVATFNTLSMKVAGPYTFRATDAKLAPAISKPITIAAAAAAKLVISLQPAAGKAGVVLTPALVVKVEDLFGNVVTTNTSTVTVAIASGPAGGSLVGTTTARAQRGVATFSTLSLKKHGTYTLRATDALLADAITKPILIA